MLGSKASKAGFNLLKFRKSKPFKLLPMRKKLTYNPQLTAAGFLLAATREYKLLIVTRL